MNVPSIFGIEISVDPELNLCLSITTGSTPLVITVTSSLVGCCIRYVFHLSKFEFASGLIQSSLNDVDPKMCMLWNV
jgi:hypothetical protein